MTFADCTVEANLATEGGGLAVDGDVLLDFKGLRVLRNEAINNGGGMWIACTSNHKSPTVLDSTFERNIAGNDGGGVYIAETMRPVSSTHAFALKVCARVRGGDGGKP